MAKQVGLGYCADCGRETFSVVCLVNEMPHCKRAHQLWCMFQTEDSRAEEQTESFDNWFSGDDPRYPGVQGATINYWDMAAYLAASAKFDPTGSTEGSDVHDD